MMRGVRQIVRFNWPFYAAGTASAAIAMLAIALVPAGATVRTFLYAATALALLWLATSLVVSWVVYDRSRLMQWGWIAQALGFRPRSWMNIHAGLDESTPALRQLLAGSTGRVFDIFHPVEMTERSVLRARRLARNAIEPETADFRQLPATDESVDAALLLLSAHELRTDGARRALFAEVARVLAPAGRAIVAEHLRDWANFLAFGPGFLHFHSRRTWTRCFASTGFDVQSEFSITPFVRIFVLRRHA
jgi:SAM-dependent methyltransferase